MKFAIVLIAFVAAFASVKSEQGPVSITNNNVGDIVTVGVQASAVLSSNVQANILTALLAALNQQAAFINVDNLDGIAPFSENKVETDVVALPETAALPDMKNVQLPELISKIKGLKVTPEMIEKVKGLLKKE